MKILNYTFDTRQKNTLLSYDNLVSLFLNAKSDNQRTWYVRNLVETQYLMTELFSIEFLCHYFLRSCTTDTVTINKNDVVLVACIKNQLDLERWITHYKQLGVTRFLLVDDNSTTALSESVTDKDVYIWKPKTGMFRYCKAFWLELLLRMHACGNWVITVDSDEYMDIPYTGTTCKPLASFIHRASANNVRYFSAFLFDLVPNIQTLPELQGDKELPVEAFDTVFVNNKRPPNNYIKHNGNVWCYGSTTDAVHKLDVRFQLNKTLDCLRKIPLFYMDSDIHLNQGFHDLIINNDRRDSTEFLRNDLLGVRHYKLFDTHLPSKLGTLRPHYSYHQGTSSNLLSLRENIRHVLKNAVTYTGNIKYSDITNVAQLLSS